MDPYDSDSSDGGPEFPPQSLPFNDPNYETYKRGQQFMIVDHTANQRNGSEVSKICQHGALLTKMATVLMELLGGLECRVKMTSLRSFSKLLIPYPAQQCQPSASESSVVQRSSLLLREISWRRTS